MRRILIRWLRSALLLAAVALGGCATFTELQMQPQVRRANAAFEEGNYALAATLFESLGERHPALPEREEFKIRQGIALYTLGSYHDARNAFLSYMKLFPVGTRREEAQIYLEKIEVLLSPDSPELKAAIDKAKKDLDALQQLHLRNPYTPDVDLAIGNLYYEMGNYEEAMRYYYEGLTIDAAYREKKLIRDRLILDEQGRPHPLTPEELERIERDGQPLVVFQTQQYLAREPYTFSNGQNRFFNVTGLVRNQSSRYLSQTSVEVRFLNSSQQVMDVAIVPLGAMGPGEVRAFRASADSYDNIYNITRFECTPKAEW